MGKIFLWYDNWHPAGCLINVYGQRAVYDAGYGIGPKLDSIIKNGSWYWPSARSNAIVAVQSRLSEVELGGLDQVIWDSKSGQFSSVETWEKLRIRYPVVDWYKIVWFASNIHKHAFFLWLAFHKPITTREKMCGWGLAGDSLCLFCRVSMESQSHIFFEYSFSKRICRSLMSECLMSNYHSDWDEIVV
jgi:hypothetical protein